MEEELNENDLEERLYAMIHHVDGTQADENAQQSHDASPRVGEAPRSTVRRYWRSNNNSAFQKVNTPKDVPFNKNTPNNKTPAVVNKNTPVPVNKNHAAAAVSDPKPKEEKDAPDSPPVGLFILQNTVPQSYTKTVEILDIDERPKVFELESSDEDEVVEVSLPPKPTITIESSDEDELIIQNDKIIKEKYKNISKENKSPNKNKRDVSASPVPSVQSSMSDDFIRGDCLALNISSAQPDSQSFDFSLHGSDLIGVSTPAKKKKKKKSKERLTSTPINPEHMIQELNNTDNIFATPKSKAKNKKPKTKSYTVSEIIIPNPDVYDSDSNQSAIDINKNHDAYAVTDKSLPSADVYESDSSVSEIINLVGKQPAPQKKANVNERSNSNISEELLNSTNATDQPLVVDLTSDYTTLDSIQVEENIVIGNITGCSDVHEYGDSVENTICEELGEFCSTKVPQILYEDLDFDNLKGKDKVCKRRRYSLTTLRAEMDKFYNESWGGENFNHQEIQKNMSRDKSLWVIDPKDRMPNPPKRRVTCNYCNRVGHRDDTCRLKPPVCHMCGHTGHYEPRCPRKICINCGSPNFMYSNSCRNCAAWRGVACAECGQRGHPASHCPDTWRRYHSTIDENMPLEQCGERPQYQLQCSGCTRRGHLAHSCRTFLPVCSLPVPSPRVNRYFRLYPPTRIPNTHKRLSNSPTTHETHANKRRNISDGDLNRPRTVSENEQNRSRKKSENEARMRKTSESENRPRTNSQGTPASEPKEAENDEVEKLPDFIPIGTNTDSNGRVIQDNEVSDTSEVKTSARIYMNFGVMRRLSTLDGQDWLHRSMDRFNVDVQYSNASSFLTVIGTVGDQEAFHSELRAWSGRSGPGTDVTKDLRNEGPQASLGLIPEKKYDVLRKLNTAFETLKNNIGDPKAIFKELTYLQNRHQTIKNQKAISPLQLSKNRERLNDVFRKLNMVLLGQAGLAGGAERLNALYSLQEKIINTRNKKVPRPLRSEISQHYQTIFTPVARNDYADLVKKFYTTSPLTLQNNSPGKNKKRKKKKINPQQTPALTNKEIVNNQPTEVDATPILTAPRSQQLNKNIKNVAKTLSCFYSRLLKNQPRNEARNATRLEIAYKILDVQKCLSECEGQTKKMQTEKMRNALKIRRQAKAFLNGEKQKKKRNNTFMNKV